MKENSISLNNELFHKNEIYKNIILICYLVLCPILMIFSIIMYIFNIIKFIFCNLFLNCNNWENDLENQYRTNL